MQDEVTLSMEQLRRMSAEAFQAGVQSERERLLEVVKDDTHPIWFGARQSAFIDLVEGKTNAE